MKKNTNMHLIFLGTGTSQGVPMLACDCAVCRSGDWHDKRLRTSALLEVDGVAMLIDAGPDFRAQLLRENVRRLDAVLLTHEHIDHIGGLDDIRAYNYFMQCPMPVYADERTLEAARSMFAYAFCAQKYPGVPDMELHEVFAGVEFAVKGVRVMPIRAMHYRLPVLAYRIGPLAYVTDANVVEEASRQMLRGCEVLVVNALRREPHLSHFTLAEALALIEDVKPRQAYLTHVSHQMGMYADLQKELPANVACAYDGLKISI